MARYPLIASERRAQVVYLLRKNVPIREIIALSGVVDTSIRAIAKSYKIAVVARPYKPRPSVWLNLDPPKQLTDYVAIGGKRGKGPGHGETGGRH